MKKVKLEIEVDVQDTTKYVAVDKDGTIIESEYSMVAPDDSIVWIAENCGGSEWTEIDTISNWRDTLTEV